MKTGLPYEVPFFSLKLPFISFLLGLARQENMSDRHPDGCEDHIEQSEYKEDNEGVSCRCVVLANQEEHNGNVSKKAEKM